MQGRAAIRITLLLAASTLWVAHALAQGAAPPPQAPLESITVTGVRPSQDAINSFLFSHVTATRVTDKVARWSIGICPQTFGLGAKYAGYITQRIRSIAASVGAPVAADPACRANIQIVFTTTPQALLDNIRQNQPTYLGYHDNSTQAARLATVTRAIQSWYTTATGDLRGQPQIDSAHAGGITLQLPSPPPTGPGGMEGFAGGVFTLNLPSANARTVTGGRLGDGLTSSFYNIIIVAEPGKLKDFEVGTLADYIAMLALTQPGALDACEDMPTITNLLLPGCRNPVSTITDGDLAYLRGIYKMSPAGTLQMQRHEILYQMRKDLKPADR
jgi:hypothetical protein